MKKHAYDCGCLRCEAARDNKRTALLRELNNPQRCVDPKCPAAKGVAHHHGKPRQVCEIAVEIARDWTNIYYGARPYLQAMATMRTIADKYGADDGDSVVAYFLSNAKTWRGPAARRIKNELNDMLKAAGK